MIRYQQGETAAFEELFLRHKRKVFGFVLGFLGSPQAAEDVFQEVFLRVIKASSGYEAKAKFTTWLYRIARNLCIDAHRRTRGLKLVPIDGEKPGEAGSPDKLADPAAPAPDQQFAAREAAIRIRRALGLISAEQREVFLLRQEGIAFEDIALITGVSGNTVKSRMRYALEALRKSLEPGRRP